MADCCTKQQCGGRCAGVAFRVSGLVLSSIYVLLFLTTMLGEASASLEGIVWLLRLWALVDVIIQCGVLRGWEPELFQRFFLIKTIGDSFWVFMLWFAVILEFTFEGGPKFLRLFRLFKLWVLVRFGMDIASVAIMYKYQKKDPEPKEIVVGTPVVANGTPHKLDEAS